MNIPYERPRTMATHDLDQDDGVAPLGLCDHVRAIEWNPYNGVVQCHVCGRVWVPLEKPPGAAYACVVDREQERLRRYR